MGLASRACQECWVEPNLFAVSLCIYRVASSPLLPPPRLSRGRVDAHQGDCKRRDKGSRGRKRKTKRKAKEEQKESTLVPYTSLGCHERRCGRLLTGTSSDNSLPLPQPGPAFPHPWWRTSATDSPPMCPRPISQPPMVPPTHRASARIT